MLRQLRSKHIQKGILIGVLAIVIPSFVVFYGWQASSRSGGSRSSAETAAATVNFASGKREINSTDLSLATKIVKSRIASAGQEMNLQLDAPTMDKLVTQKEILDEAINMAIIEDYAKRHDITATRDETDEWLAANIPVQYRGQYIRQWALPGMSNEQVLESFMQEQEKLLLLRKVRADIASKARPSYYEGWQEYLNEKEKLVADYVRFDVSEYLQKVKIDDNELKSFFEKNKELFRVPDQIQYAFVLVTKDDLKSSVTVTEDDITSYYNAHKEEYRSPRTAHVRQIFLKKPDFGAEGTSTTEEMTSATEKVRSLANDLHQRIAKGEDFGAIADKYNEVSEGDLPPREENITTATDSQTTAGGDLGYISENTAKGFYGDEWTSAAFNMPAGTMTQPFTTGRGYHILKIEGQREGVLQPLSETRDIIKPKLLNMMVEPVFEKTGENLRANARKYTTLEKLAEATSLTLGLTEKVTKGTQFIPKIGPLGTFSEAIADLQKGGDKEVLGDNDRLLILDIREEFPAHDPTLDEVREKAEAEYKKDKARGMAEADARKLKDKSTSYAAMQTAAVDMGLTVTQSRPFTRQEASGVLGPIDKFADLSSALKKDAIELSPLGVAKDPSGYVVWHLADKIQPEKLDFAKDLPKTLSGIAVKKDELLINELIRDQRRELKNRIEITKGYR